MAGPERSGSLSLGARIIIRQLRAQPAAVITIFAAILVGTFLITGAPRLFEDASARDLRAAVTDPPAESRHVTLERVDRIGLGSPDDPLIRVRETGLNFADAEFPPTLQSVAPSSAFVVDSPRFAVSKSIDDQPLGHNFPVFIRYRYQEGIEDRLRLVRGAMPTRQERIPLLMGSDCPEDPEEAAELMELLQDPEAEPPEDLEFCAVVDVRHIQTVVTASTLEDIGLELNQQVLLAPDQTDGLYFGTGGGSIALIMSVSGVIELGDETEEYWYDDTSLHRPVIRENADFRLIYATGFLDPDDYGNLIGATIFVPWQYRWRHFVDPDLVGEVVPETLVDELRDLQIDFPSTTRRPLDFAVITRLPLSIESHLTQQEEALSLVSSSIAGLFTVVIASLLLLSVLMNSSQRSSTVLDRGRGASKPQMLLTRIYEGLLIIVPPAAIGYLAATWLLPDADYLFPYRAAVALATGGVISMVVAGLPQIRRPLGQLLREEGSTPVASGRRVVFEVFATVLAVGALLLLRRRGQIDDAVEGFDLLLAAAPTAIALGVAIIATRIYPLVINLFAWVGGRMRGLVGFVGFRRIVKQNLGMRLSLVVILLCVATASFASVTRASLLTGQKASSWQAVGAEYAVKNFVVDSSLSTSLDFEAIGPIEAVAFGSTFERARAEVDLGSFAAQVLAVDGAEYAEITSGTPGDVDLPPFIVSPPPLAPGEPIPVIVSELWPSEGKLRLGDVFTLDLGRLRPSAIVAEVREVYPDTDVNRSFVILSRDTVQSLSDVPIQPTVAYLDAPGSAAEQIISAVADQSISSRVLTRAEALDRIADDPFVIWVGRGLALVAGFAVILGMVAAVSALALATASRRRDFGYLRTMGLIPKQATAMTVMEQLPSALFAIAGGIIAGIGAAFALRPAVDLDAFTGELVPTAIDYNPLAIAAGALVLLGTLAIGVGIFSVFSRRDDLGRTLRVGDE